MDWAFWAAAVAAAICVGMGKGGMPMVGMLSVPILSLMISPVAAAGLLLPIYVVSDAFGLWAYRHDWNARVIAIMAAGMTVGVGLGWATASMVPEHWVTLLVGVIGMAFAGVTLLRRNLTPAPKEARVAPGLFWGTITGFTSFVSHAGGPPYQVYVQPLGLSKTAFAGTATIAFAYVNAIKLVPYWFLGQISPASLSVAVWLAVPAALAVFAGVRLVRVLPERLFFRLVTLALLAISVKLVWEGLSPA
ncbi:MAG: sulfite exporter TauE/SafE family protein [Gemmobacter sp.]